MFKGTIFERGNSLGSKFRRHLAWLRVRKLWLFMPRKEYKQSMGFQFLGILTWMFGIWFALYVGLEKAFTWLISKFEK